jgi:hypothetical protein
MLTACDSDERLVAPGISANHLPPSPPFSVPIPAHNMDFTDWTSTGIEVPAGVQVIVTVSGTLNYTLNPHR